MRDEKCKQERASYSGSLGKDSRGQRPWGLKVSRERVLPVWSLHRDFPIPEAGDASDPDFPLAERDPVPQTKKVDDSHPPGIKKGIILSLGPAFPRKRESGPQAHYSIPPRGRQCSWVERKGEKHRLLLRREPPFLEDCSP